MGGIICKMSPSYRKELNMGAFKRFLKDDFKKIIALFKDNGFNCSVTFHVLPQVQNIIKTEQKREYYFTLLFSPNQPLGGFSQYVAISLRVSVWMLSPPPLLGMSKAKK